MYYYFFIDVPQAPLNVMSSCISYNNEVSVMNISWNHSNDLYLNYYEISIENVVFSVKDKYTYIVLNGEEQFLTVKAVDICNQKSSSVTHECKFITL